MSLGLWASLETRLMRRLKGQLLDPPILQFRRVHKGSQTDMLVRESRPNLGQGKSWRQTANWPRSKQVPAWSTSAQLGQRVEMAGTWACGVEDTAPSVKQEIVRVFRRQFASSSAGENRLTRKKA